MKLTNKPQVPNIDYKDTKGLGKLFQNWYNFLQETYYSLLKLVGAYDLNATNLPTNNFVPYFNGTNFTWKAVSSPFIIVGGFTSDDVDTAIAAIPSTGGIVYFPAGTYNITKTIAIPYSNVTLYGAGRSSIIKAMAWASWVTPGHIINISAKHNTIIRDLFLDGNSANTGQTSNGINITSSNDCQILNNFIQYCDTGGISATTCNGLLIDGNELDSNDASAIYTYGYSGAGYNNIIINNTSRNHTVYGSAAVYASYLRAGLISNNSSYNDSFGFYITANYDILVTNNTVQQAINIGAYFYSGAVVFNNNELIACGTGMQIDKVVGGSFCGNVIKSSTNHGILITYTLTNNGLTISGNTFITNGNNKDDIYIGAGTTATNILIANNVFVGAAGYAERAINILGGSNIKIIGNISYLHDTCGINIAAGITGVVISSNDIQDTTKIIDAGTGTVIDNYDGTNFSFNKALAITPFTTAGILHNAVTTGVVSSSLIVDADVNANAAIALSKIDKPYLHAYRTNSYDIATGGVWYNIGFDVTVASSGITKGDYTQTYPTSVGESSNNKFTFSEAGTYRVYTNVQFVKTTGNNTVTRLILNNTSEIAGSASYAETGNTLVQAGFDIKNSHQFMIVIANVNDYISLQVATDNAGLDVGVSTASGVPASTTTVTASITIERVV